MTALFDGTPDDLPRGAAWAIEIVRAGVLTTLQDLGRPGLGRYGVSPSGAMDLVAHRLAGALVGNPADAATLEITGPGTALRFLRPVHFAIAGADLDAACDDRPIARFVVHAAAAGARLTFRGRRAGARVALAMAGELAVARWFGSVATDLSAGIGGPSAGAPLRAGVRLALRDGEPAAIREGPVETVVNDNEVSNAWDTVGTLPVAGAPTPLRYVAESSGGVDPDTAAAFARVPFRVSTRSNRTGFRFEGPSLAPPIDRHRLSEPTAPGAIQLPPDGHPILLMADRNTTGGYPRLGHLCTADRSRAAQLWPGDPVVFVPVTLGEARGLAIAAEAALQSLLSRLPR